MTTTERLERIYSKLPSVACKGLCHEACGPILASKAEVERVERVGGRNLTVVQGLRCSMLEEDKRCAAYEARPLICRLFGVVKKMRCPHGCKPSKWLSDSQAHTMLWKVDRVPVEGQP